MSGPEHSPIAPSSAARWVQCPGSVALSAAYPQEETQRQREGTAAHWACVEVLQGRTVDVGVIAPNGVVLTEEMCDGAEIYADAVRADITSTAAWHIETRVDCPDIHEQSWGTPDAWVFDRPVRRLVITDYKFGHRLVDPFECWQLINYASGILRVHDVTGLEDQALTVTMRIVQPRGYHRDGPVREWVVTASDLRPYFNRLAAAATVALQPGATCTPGPECRDCAGRHACEALQRAGYQAADAALSSVPLELSPSALARELQLLERSATLLDARITGLSTAAQALLRAGATVPGYSLEQGSGRERWKAPVAEVVMLGQMMGVDVSKPGTLTPKQAIKAGLPAELVNQYSETPRGEVKLVPDGTRLAAVFGGARAA